MFVYRYVVVCVNLVFLSALHRSTSAAYVMLGLNVCASHPYNHTTDRERESASQPASYSVSVCSLLSFACSFVGALWRWLPPLSVVLPAVCFFLRGHTGLFQCAAPMTVSHCRSQLSVVSADSLPYPTLPKPICELCWATTCRFCCYFASPFAAGSYDVFFFCFGLQRQSDCRLFLLSWSWWLSILSLPLLCLLSESK